MSIDVLFADFDRLIQSAESVHRLRRFVLDLAVRGKLAPQDPNDEPASELLKRIALEKARLVKAGEIRKQKILLPVHRGDIPVKDIPGWIWVRLGEVSTVITKGSTPTSYGHAYTKEGVNFVKVESIKGGSLLPKNITSFIGNATHDFLARSQLAAGDILFSIAGSIGTCAVVTDRVLPANTNQALAIIRGTKTVFLAEFLLQLLRSSVAQSVVLKARGGAMSNISLDDIQNFVVPLPPLAEQHRIVAKVGELMVLCDRLEAARAEREATRDRLATASLARLNVPDPDSAKFQHNVAFALKNLAPLTTRPDQIKALRQTILNLAVHGKLVPQDPNDEPASELLKRVIAENEATFVKGRKRKFLIGLRSDDEVPKNIPATWTWSSIGQLASEMRYGTAKKCEHRIKGTPVLRIPNVSRGEVDLTNLKFGALTEEEKKTLLLRENDLLVVRSNGSLGIVGRAAIVNKAAESMSFAGYLVRIRFRQRYIHTRYIWLAMNSQHVRDLIEKPIRSTVGLKNVNSTELAAITIPLPPLAEQQRIVAKIDELMTLCDRMEASLAWGNDNRRQLIDALLHEALKPEEECEKLAG